MKCKSSTHIIIQVLTLLLAFIFIAGVFSGCKIFFNPEEKDIQPPVFSSFLEIPRITEAEIKAIEALNAKNDYFIYGMPLGIGAFSDENGEIKGYSALICEWLSELFNIEFKLVHYEWSELLAGLENKNIDFSGELSLIEEHRKIYTMTDTIAERHIKCYRLADSKSFSYISETRLPRYGFLKGSRVDQTLASEIPPDSFEHVYLENFSQVRSLLKNKKIDAFFYTNNADAYFDQYDDIVNEVSIPLIYVPNALSTQNPELDPIISVVQKALEGGAIYHLNELYNQGYNDYLKHKLYSRLTDEELKYIKSNSVVPFLAKGDNYPLSFYDQHDDQWKGIAFDVLAEIEELTGLTFKVTNKHDDNFSDLLKRLESGKAPMISELIRTKEREGRFLWPNTYIMTDYYILVSKSEHRNINVNEILSVKVGLLRDTAYSEVFRKWFPYHTNIIEYETVLDAFNALDKDEIDMVMSTNYQLLILTNYLEKVGFKANVIFDYYYESTFGFNNDSEILCSIVCKAMMLTDTELITKQWTSKTYDYRVKLMQSQLPWLIVAICSLLLVILLLVILVQRNRRQGRQMEKLVVERTNQLELQTSTLRTMLNAIPDLVFCKDLNLRFTMVNKGFEVYFDTTEEDVLGENDINALQIPPLVAKTFSEIDKRVISERHVFAVEEYLPTKSGGALLFETIKAPLIKNGKVVGLIGISRDISIRKAAEEELRLASLTKSAFLAHMSHEIRTPMNSIIGFSELALDDDISLKTREYLIKIIDNSDWLLQIINDILDISKIESGKMELEKVPFDLSDMFNSCRTIISQKAIEKGVELYFYAEPVIDKSLLGDPLRLRQVLINILSNAVKFTNIGTVKLSATVKNSDDKCYTIYFEIKDTGIGMTPEQQIRVFEPFAQADTGTTRKYGGTGLGLPITKSIIELMGGKLKMKSIPGIGSTFSFELTFDVIEISNKRNGGKSNKQNIEKPFFNGTVLLCEDNNMNQRVICEHLSRVGLNTVVAQNGKEGVELALDRAQNGKPFDLIFMDIHMPVMDGIEATKTLINEKIKTPIIAMTANIMKSDIKKYNETGMRAFVSKPFTSQELWRCLLKYLTPVNKNEEQEKGPLDMADEKLLEELLIDFAKSYQTKLSEFQTAVDTGDLKLAYRLVHSLKTNAAIIGKMNLHKTAAEIELTLKESKFPVSWQMLALKTELNTVLDELKPMLAKSDESIAKTEPQANSLPLKIGKEKTAELLGRLLPFLKSGNPECLKLIDELKAIPGSTLLISQMEDYDFEAALITLNELRGGL